MEGTPRRRQRVGILGQELPSELGKRKMNDCPLQDVHPDLCLITHGGRWHYCWIHMDRSSVAVEHVDDDRDRWIIGAPLRVSEAWMV